MYRFRSFILLAVISVLLSASVELRAQDAPIKWGEIPMEDLQMKSLPSDTNASAYILCDYGKQHFNDDLDLVYERHLRVKILNTKGFSWGTHSISVYTYKGLQSLRDIDAATYYLDENGEMVEKELKSKDVFKEKASENVTRYKFTLPALQPGCIIEIKYKIVARELWFAKGWEFQYSEPARWSEFRFTTPKRIDYALVTTGYEPWEIQEENNVVQMFNGSASSYLGAGFSTECIQYRRAVKDVPALRDEPFTTNIDDYKNSLRVQLRGFIFSGMIRYQQVMSDWETVSKELLERDDFGERIESSEEIDKLASEITAGLSGQTQKLQAIYNWVTKSIVWDGDYAITADRDFEDVLEQKKGSNADITFFMLSLLKSAGISCEPVITSTRGNGRIITIYPLINQFDYLLLRATTEKFPVYIDATDPARPMELLPYRLLNTQGLLVKPGAPEFVMITSPKRYMRSSVTNVRLQPDGSFTGRVCDSYSDYAALGLRKDLKDKEKKETDIVKERLDANKYGLDVDSISIVNLDSLQSVLKISSNISSSSYAQASGDMIYINPQIVHRSDTNPLKSEVRKFPVDYGYRYTFTDTINIELPDSFEVKEKFPDRSAFAAAGNIRFLRNAVIDSSRIKIITKMEINELMVKPSYYAQLRNFYSQTMAFHSEQLVLQKRKPVVQAAAAEQPAVEQPAAPLQGKPTADKKTKSSEKGKNGKKKS